MTTDCVYDRFVTSRGLYSTGIRAVHANSIYIFPLIGIEEPPTVAAFYRFQPRALTTQSVVSPCCEPASTMTQAITEAVQSLIGAVTPGATALGPLQKQGAEQHGCWRPAARSLAQ